MPTEKTEQRPYGDGVTAPIHPIDPEALEAAATLVEAFLGARASGHATARLEFLGNDSTLVKTDALVSALGLLLVDYRHHRPTQWAYDQACAAIEKHRQRADTAESDVRDLADHLGQLLGENSSAADRNAARDYLGQLVHRAAKAA
jgi:hypothetical protein